MVLDQNLLVWNLLHADQRREDKAHNFQEVCNIIFSLISILQSEAAEISPTHLLQHIRSALHFSMHNLAIACMLVSAFWLTEGRSAKGENLDQPKTLGRVLVVPYAWIWESVDDNLHTKLEIGKFFQTCDLTNMKFNSPCLPI